MALAILNSITLSAAIDAKKDYFQVSSTASVAVGDIAVVDLEAFRINSIPSSGWVSVTRGVGGTLAKAHPAATKVYTGTPDKFASLRNYALGLFGDSASLPQYLMPGCRAKDGLGSEYVLCDTTTAMYGGVTVAISGDGNWNATILAAGAKGPVGVTAEQASASDQLIWVQVYGFCNAQETNGDSAGTSALIACAASTASTPSVGLSGLTCTSDEVHLIYGMFISGAASTAVTSATSHTGVQYPVFLNYPYVRGYVDFAIDPTS